MLGIHVLVVRHKKYVLCFAGRKRGTKVYDLLAPNGAQIEARLFWEEAVEAANTHYIENTNFAKRNSNKAKQEPLRKSKNNNEVFEYGYEEFTSEPVDLTNTSYFQSTGVFE